MIRVRGTDFGLLPVIPPETLRHADARGAGRKQSVTRMGGLLFLLWLSCRWTRRRLG